MEKNFFPTAQELFPKQCFPGTKKHGGFNSEARHIHIRMHKVCVGGWDSVCIPEHDQFKIYITEYSQH